MKRNFKLIWGFWIAEKEIKKRSQKSSSEDFWWLNVHPVVKEIIDNYYENWIREFFIWYNPSYWHNEFWFEFSPNWRFWENEQITSYETFKQAIEYVHSLKTDDWKQCEIFLTVNFWYYSDLTMPLMQKIIQEAISAWIDGLITSNMEILEYLAEIKFKGKVNISTIFSVFNQDAMSFLIEYIKDSGLNLSRMIIPREITLNEMKHLTSVFPDIQFEVFWHWDYCRYSNGLCFAEHKYFARDLCTFVLKHWLDVKKTIRYDFKKFILDSNLSDQEKQHLIDNSLEDIEHIFISHNLVDSNWENILLDKYTLLFQNKFYNEKTQQEIKDLSLSILSKLKSDIKLNLFKYIYDWLVSPQDLHNRFIDKVLNFYDILKTYSFDESLEVEINKIRKLREKSLNYFNNILREKWKFWVETYYKFMLYNRTSVPFYRFFNDITNIEVVKIPLRGRDLSVMKLRLELIDEALENPWKFIDEGNLSWKYFHYDPSKLDVFSMKFDELSK